VQCLAVGELETWPERLNVRGGADSCFLLPRKGILRGLRRGVRRRAIRAEQCAR